MSSENIQLEVVSPDRLVLEETVAEVVLPGSEGYLGVRAGHTPLLTRIGIGELTFTQGGRTHSVAVAQGFAEVLPDRVSILCKAAERLEEIDVDRAETARTRAQKELAEIENAWDQSFRRAEVRLRRAVNRIAVARKSSGG